MNITQISDWQKYLRDGEQFLKTSKSAYGKKRKAFSPEVLYNLICMGIEKFIMAFLMKNGDLAENHTMEDLVRALERHTALSCDLTEKLKHLDSFQEICDLESYTIKKPSVDDIAVFLQTAEGLRAHLSPYLYELEAG